MDKLTGEEGAEKNEIYSVKNALLSENQRHFVFVFNRGGVTQRGREAEGRIQS